MAAESGAHDSESSLFSCFAMIWRVPLTVFEGDNEAAAAGVFRRAHIASFHSNAQMLPADEDTTVAPIMMPRMMPSANPAVPEVSIRVVDGQTRVVQLASRVPNRLADSDFAGQEYAAPQGAAPYPSLLLAEKEEEERARAAEARARGGSSSRGGPSPGGGRGAPQSAARPPAAVPGLPRVASGGSVRRSGSKEELQSGITGVLGGLPPGYQGQGAGYQSAALGGGGSQGDLSRTKQRGGSFGQLPPRGGGR